MHKCKNGCVDGQRTFQELDSEKNQEIFLNSPFSFSLLILARENPKTNLQTFPKYYVFLGSFNPTMFQIHQKQLQCYWCINGVMISTLETHINTLKLYGYETWPYIYLHRGIQNNHTARQLIFKTSIFSFCHQNRHR